MSRSPVPPPPRARSASAPCPFRPRSVLSVAAPTGGFSGGKAPTGTLVGEPAHRWTDDGHPAAEPVLRRPWRTPPDARAAGSSVPARAGRTGPLPARDGQARYGL
ncbi:hypothetical protein SSCG_02492 [Streptomyces clavuligerus]|nr:hypothetical protein SSCG_02492 [Streptomyces clavuligerus]